MSNDICFLVTLLLDGQLKRVALTLDIDQMSAELLSSPITEPDNWAELSTYLPTELQLEGKILEVVSLYDSFDARPRATATKQYLNKMQRELYDWDKKNFGEQPSYRSLLGATEELGELAHAHLKEEQGIRESNYEEDAKDAIGDTIIYLTNYCNARGFNLQGIIEETWNQVRQRDWIKYPKTGRPGVVKEREMLSQRIKESLMRGE